MKRLGKTPPFVGPHREPVPGSLTEVKYLDLGGVDQWVMIRGENVENPPLILLHGGPGFSETTLFRHFNAPLEKHFTVVYWDQRGAGKSFDKRLPRSSMTVEQFISDLDELVDWVLQRLGKEQVVLFGHSWGSALGVLYAERFPQKVAAYVGCGQICDAAAGERGSYAWALAEAQRLHHSKALASLRALGPPPHSTDALFAERTWVQRLERNLRPRTLWKLARAILSAKESSLLELPSALRAFRFSIDAMADETNRLNLIELVPELPMPVFLFLGRNDHFVPPEQGAAWLEALYAPIKKLLWFEHSGHEPFMDEPEKFNQAMVELVRPLLKEAERPAPFLPPVPRPELRP